MMGSPPRGRGKDGNEVQLIAAEGITPAWAGKSLFCFTAAVPIQDHPRMGGEKFGWRFYWPFSLGSPPRGRGKESLLDRYPGVIGITPAWAGKRQFYSPLPCLRRDHPRVGGEKSRASSSMRVVQGSPPHGRGKGLGLAVNVLGDGITPAWAGKSESVAVLQNFIEDHPRVGGEKFITASLYRSGTGSPPRGRGKGHRAGRSHHRAGITPA